MKLIKKLGVRLNNTGKSYQSWGEFLCLIPNCGNIVERILGNGKKAQSCGCATNELIAKKKIKHGDRGTKLYKIWQNMKSRCNNSKSKSYKDYGGRGILICPEWTNDYIKFRDWALSNGYKENLEIDRENTNGNYEPSNCRFVTKQINNQNRRNNIIQSIEQANEIRTKYNSGYYTQKQLAKEYNVSTPIISYIINNKIWRN